MFTVESYNNFFRTAAVRHVNILHNIAAEGQDSPKGEASFFVGIDSAINGVRTQQVTDKCTLVLLKYEAKGRENNALDYRAMYSGGFIVCKSADASDISDVEAAEKTAEETAWDIINLMVSRMVDAGTGLHCASPFGELDLNDFTMTHVGPFLDKQFGWLVEFDFLVSRYEIMSADRLLTQFN